MADKEIYPHEEEEPYLDEEEPYLEEEEPSFPDEEKPSFLDEEKPSFLDEEKPSFLDEEEPSSFLDEEEPYLDEEYIYPDEEECYRGQGVLWRREELIGRGSFANVYLATSVFGSNLPPRMAVKSTIHREVYLREKKVLEDLGRDCPFIINYLGSDQSRSNNNTTPSYDLFFEYAAGGTLRDVLNPPQSDRLGAPETDVRRYTRDILRGLVHVHSRGYVHCDIKPDNILLVGAGSDSVAKIGDFGLAKPVKYMCPPEERGTADYAPPESGEWQELEPSSDIWSVGCTVRELLTGSVEKEKKKKKKKRLSRKAAEFIKACMNVKAERRWTAEMLLKHPFVCEEKAVEKKRKGKEEDGSEIRKRRKVEKFIEASMDLMAEDISTAQKLLRESLVDGLGEIQREMKIKDRRKRINPADMMISQLITNIM